MSNYFGRQNDQAKDRFDRRVVKQLDDITFESEEDEDGEIEEVKNLRRMGGTILTEDNLKRYLNHDMEKLYLDYHYWISNHFLSKMSFMAPNIGDLSIRGLKISTEAGK